MNKYVKKGEYLDIILRSKKTVFTAKDIALLWGDAVTSASRVRLSSYVKNNKLIRLRRGVYAKDGNYDKYELANAILRPSYVSFETVLAEAGIVFQYNQQIFVASYVKRDIVCDQSRYVFRKISLPILINPAGIIQEVGYCRASAERAFLDTVYRSKAYYFDNLSPLNWDEVFALLPIYDSKAMNKKIQEYYEDYKANQ